MTVPDASKNIDQLRYLTEAAFRAVAVAPASQTDAEVGLLFNKNYSADIARALLRGRADYDALYLRAHDAALHRRSAPQDLLAREIFNAIEDARLEAVAAPTLPGVVQNLTAVLADNFARRDLTYTEAGDVLALPHVLRLWARGALLGMNANLPPPWQAWVNENLVEFSAQFRARVNDQSDFAQITHALLRHLRFQQPHAEESDAVEAEEEKPDAPAKMEGDEDSTDSHTTSPMPDADQDNLNLTFSDEMPEDRQYQDSGGAEETDMGMAYRAGAEFDPDAPGDYRVYSRVYDEIAPAENLALPDELKKLRAQLDAEAASLQPLIAKLANRLQRQLMAERRHSWVFDQEEGILDSARLARVVTNPTQPLRFKQERAAPFQDTVVTLLIDNSGSMRGRPIMIAALSADILARTLERCGVKVEILGFTTAAWKGGHARAAWLADGAHAPRQPGRLNDLRHIIYKSADQPWHRRRTHLALMLQEGLLKENIDGEALLWAAARLGARPEVRKILIMISDGAPVDDSTLSLMPNDYLERHLRAVITQIQSGAIELRAIGIGHDVGRYYQHAITISDIAQLGETLINQLTELFVPQHRARF